jgi:hypothetical protein
MDNEEIKAIYLNAEKVVSMLQTPYGKKLLEKQPQLLKIATQTVNEFRLKYYDIRLNSEENVNNVVQSIEDAVNALKIIPQTSHESIAVLNKLITENSEKLQNDLLFDSSTFYEKYFSTLPSTLNDDLNEDFLNNPRFKQWFGNSKVVDDDNKPRLVYHGTGGDVEEFSNFKFDVFPGAYFAQKKSYSDWFANIRGGSSFVFRCYLRVQNPIDLTPFEVRKVYYNDFVNYIKLRYGIEMPENKMLMARSEAKGGMWAWEYLRVGVDWLKLIKNTNEYDGFHYYENNPDDKDAKGVENVTPAWLVLNANQIKTSDMRNDTYSLFSDDIRMMKGGKVC